MSPSELKGRSSCRGVVSSTSALALSLRWGVDKQPTRSRSSSDRYRIVRVQTGANFGADDREFREVKEFREFEDGADMLP